MPADTQHPSVQGFQPPDGNMKMWRYMDLLKLIDLLETRSLHFSRADILGDPHEGTWPEPNIVDRERHLPKMVAAHKGEIELEKYRLITKDMTHFARQTIYINCWHGGETENDAMWKLHGTMLGSVVIQSTYKKLLEALPNSTYLGMVQYQEYSHLGEKIPTANTMYPFMYKRKELEHEKEVRALNRILGGGAREDWVTREGRIKREDLPKGIKVDIDINKVVEEIRLRPATPTWVKGVIDRLLKRYSWDIKVIPSQIDIDPRY